CGDRERRPGCEVLAAPERPWSAAEVGAGGLERALAAGGRGGGRREGHRPRHPRSAAHLHALPAGLPRRGDARRLPLVARGNGLAHARGGGCAAVARRGGATRTQRAGDRSGRIERGALEFDHAAALQHPLDRILRILGAGAGRYRFVRRAGRRRRRSAARVRGAVGAGSATAADSLGDAAPWAGLGPDRARSRGRAGVPGHGFGERNAVPDHRARPLDLGLGSRAAAGAGGHGLPGARLAGQPDPARHRAARRLTLRDRGQRRAGAAPFAPRAKQARKVADNPSQAGRPAPGKVKGAAPAGWGSRGASVAASTLAERKRVARRSRAGPRASQCQVREIRNRAPRTAVQAHAQQRVAAFPAPAGPAPPRSAPRLFPHCATSELILKLPGWAACGGRKINAHPSFRIFSDRFAQASARCAHGWQPTRTSDRMRNSLLLSALVLAIGAASTVPLRADGIYPTFTSTSSAGSVSSDGSFLSPNVYGSSAFASNSDQARSFVNLSTGEIGAYVAGLNNSASTSTDATDSWTGVAECVSNCDDFNFGVNFDISATLNHAAANAYKEIDYTFADTINQLRFSLVTDGLGDFETEANWNGTDVSSNAQQSFDSNGNWNVNFHFSAPICAAFDPCQILYPTTWNPELLVQAT